MDQQYNMLDSYGRVIVVRIIAGKRLDVFYPLSRAGSYHHAGPAYQTTYYSDEPNISLIASKIAMAPKQLDAWIHPTLGEGTPLVHNSFMAVLGNEYFCVSPKFVHSFTTDTPLVEMRSEMVAGEWYPYAVDALGSHYLIYEGVILKNVTGRLKAISDAGGPYAYYAMSRSMNGFGKIIRYQLTTRPGEPVTAVYSPRPYDAYHAIMAHDKKLGETPRLIALGSYDARASVSLQQFCGISEKFGEVKGFAPIAFGPFAP